MSGRSAYVRKKKAEVKEERSAPTSGLAQSPSDVLFGYVSEDEDEDFAPAGALPHSSALVTSPTHNSRKSASSGGSRPLKNSQPEVQSGFPGGTLIQKSKLRSFMDENSEKFRNKIASAFTGGKSRNPNSDQYGEMSRLTSKSKTGLTLPTKPSIYNLHQTVSGRGLSKEYHNEGYDMKEDEAENYYMRYKIKRFGPGGSCGFWYNIIKDSELWDETGDTIVYLSFDRLDARGTGPSFRVHSSDLRKLNSPFFNTCLDEGCKLGVFNGFDHLPATSTATGLAARSSTASSVSPHRPNSDALMPGERNSFNTTSPHTSLTTSNYQAAVYEIYIFCNNKLSPREKVSQHLTTRNVFALLFGIDSMVGMKYSDILPSLLERLNHYIPPSAENPYTNVARIIEWLENSKLDDVRNDFGRAASLLKWSETEDIRYVAGFREAFVHCAGIYDDHSDQLLATIGVDVVTRRQIELRATMLQLHVSETASILADFDLSEMWIDRPGEAKRTVATQKLITQSKAAFDRCRKFLLDFYSVAYGVWPPMKERGAHSWLTRQVVRRLQADFGALFDFLVDREVGWDSLEARSSRKWEILHNTKIMFDADSEDLPFTDMLVRFDNLHQYPHIPNPYPLVPPHAKMVPSDWAPKGRVETTEDISLSNSRAILSYMEATNIDLVPSKVVSNRLVDAFINFEKVDCEGVTDPHDARRGRWIIIYGILQTLAAVSVDTPGVRHTQGVKYFLNAKVTKLGQWLPPGIQDPAHHMSHCWTVQSTWQSSMDEAQSWQDASQTSRSQSIRSQSIHTQSARTQSVQGHRSTASKSSLDRRNTTNTRGSASLKRNGFMFPDQFNGAGLSSGDAFSGTGSFGPRSSFAASDRSGGAIGFAETSLMTSHAAHELVETYSANHGEEILRRDILRSQAEVSALQGKPGMLTLQSTVSQNSDSPKDIEREHKQNSTGASNSHNGVETINFAKPTIEAAQTALEDKANDGYEDAIPTQDDESDDMAYFDDPDIPVRRNTVATSNPSKRRFRRLDMAPGPLALPSRRPKIRPTLNDVEEVSTPVKEPESSSENYQADGESPTPLLDKGKAPVRNEVESSQGQTFSSHVAPLFKSNDANEVFSSPHDHGQYNAAPSRAQHFSDSAEALRNTAVPYYYDYSEETILDTTAPHQQANDSLRAGDTSIYEEYMDYVEKMNAHRTYGTTRDRMVKDYRANNAKPAPKALPQVLPKPPAKNVKAGNSAELVKDYAKIADESPYGSSSASKLPIRSNGTFSRKHTISKKA